MYENANADISVPTTFGIHASKLVVRPTVNINSFLVSRILQSEQSDILHSTYPLHILLEIDLGILRKYSEYIKKINNNYNKLALRVLNKSGFAVNFLC